jgi:hypothetical protein
MIEAATHKAEVRSMNGDTGQLSLAEECRGHRINIAGLIRAQGGLGLFERAELERRGLRFDPVTGAVTWSPPPGETDDLATEREHLLYAVFLLVGPPRPFIEEELAEAIARGKTFGDLLAELGVFNPKEQVVQGE